MVKCKFNPDMDCDLFNDPENVCWYEDLEDCICFRTGKYKSHDDVNKKGDCGVEFFDNHKYTHSFVKRIIAFFFTNGKIE